MFESDSFSDSFYRTCSDGFRRMSPEAGKRLAETVAQSQGPCGLFFGRAGREDLYYTFFGLLLALVSGTNIRRSDCGRGLRSIDFSSLDLVHGCAWLRATRMLRALAVPRFLRSYFHAIPWRLSDGSDIRKLESLANLPAAVFPQQDPCSPYSRFLSGTLYSDCGKSMPPFDIGPYRLPNGLFANLRNGNDYGLNATAAAMFLLPKDRTAQTADSLSSLQESDGSFKAAASAPCGDLLSTATASFALRRCGRSPKISVKQFLRDCFRDDGLFAATPDDAKGDLEYAVYGLLAMGTIS